MVNGKLRKLCAYFAASDQAVKASGDISGSSSGLPKVMLRPVIASTMKQVAVSQWTNRSKRVEAHDGAAGPPALDAHRAAPHVEADQQHQHAEDGDGADPAQRDFVELLPVRGRRAGSARLPCASGMLMRPLTCRNC